VQRRQLSLTMADELFLTQFREWIREMRVIANDRPGTGACAFGHRHADVAVDARPPAPRPRLPMARSSTRARARA